MKRCMCFAHDWNAKSQDRWKQLCFASSSRVRPSCETLTKHFVLPNCPIWYTLSIPTLPTNIEECFYEKALSHKPWELEIVIPTYLYTFACGFSLTLTSPFPYHWEVDSPNTYHTLSECSVTFWCCLETLEEAKDGRCNMELVARFGEVDKTRFREALLD